MGISAGAPADEISGRVDLCAQAGVAEEGEGPLARLAVRVGIGKSGDAALRIPAELREGRQIGVEPRAVHAERRLPGKGVEPPGDEYGQTGAGEEGEKLAAMHAMGLGLIFHP